MPDSPPLLAARRLARAARAPIVPVDGALPAGLDGAVLLADAPLGDALLAEIAVALPRCEALVLWLPGADTAAGVELLDRHGFAHGMLNDVALPEPGVLAVLASDEGRAARNELAVNTPDRPFSALAIMPAFNEADVIHHAIGALVAEGVDVYLIDHESTDGTVAAASPWLGRGLVTIESFPGDSGYAERNHTEMVWRDILARVGEVSGERAADWYLFVNADEFREAPFTGMTLRDGLREADELGYSAVNFELADFRPTPEDAFVPGQDVRLALGHYEPPGSYDELQVKAWKAQPTPVDIVTHGGHDVLFAGKRVFPVPFILRHYPIRSAEHGRRKVLAERLARFAAEERADGWHVQYDRYVDGAEFLQARDTLVAWNGDRFRAELMSRVLRQVLLVNAARGSELALGDLEPHALTAWMARRGHGTVTTPDIQAAQGVLLQRGAQTQSALTAIADDLGAIFEAQARLAGNMQLSASLGGARAALHRAA
ncbi:MAG TPA: glycosyltransferase family 2 protein [Gaiellales bacterium]